MSAKPVRGRGVASLPEALRTGGGTSEAHPTKGFYGIGFRLTCTDPATQRVYGWTAGHSTPPSLSIPQGQQRADEAVGFRLVWNKE